MVFSSSLFLLYFLPVFLLTYFLVSKPYKNLVALVASVLFYMWGAPVFIFVVAASIVADFFIVRWLASEQGRKKRLGLALSVILNVGLLVYFKYANFLVDNLNELILSMGWRELSWVKVALPIGISFFTFQKLSYSIDVYRGVHAPLRRLPDYALYIILFPQLIAGPIVRFHEIADQIVDRSHQENADNRLLGLFRFIIGLAKKVLIANTLGEQVDAVFALPGDSLGTGVAWIGIIAYSFQIYYDFAGYSDMAIGIGRMIGFKFPENFNNPYISQNITEFWRRWHMTLSRWMKDYLYIPLGGSRVKTSRRLYFNLWIVFLISGLWHGAAWNFIVWGAFHGLFLVLDRLFLVKLGKRIGKIPSVIFTYLITLVGWVLFRAESFVQIRDYLHAMFSWHPAGYHLNPGLEFWFFIVLGAFFAFFAIGRGIEDWQNRFLSEPTTTKAYIYRSLASVVILLLCIGFITSSGFNPFIYFRF
ncbi:MAG: MBOAT family protein [Bacteroidales bacterium]|nr:MBOAT family protein [Bacteroidales bacterium]